MSLGFLTKSTWLLPSVFLCDFVYFTHAVVWILSSQLIEALKAACWSYIYLCGTPVWSVLWLKSRILTQNHWCQVSARVFFFTVIWYTHIALFSLCLSVSFYASLHLCMFLRQNYLLWFSFFLLLRITFYY